MPQPPLIVVSGLPASGKTSLGTGLAGHLGLPFVSKDEYKELLHERLPGLTSAQSGPLSFELMYHVAGVVLRAGTGCILETHFHLGVSEPKILALAEAHGAALVQVFCHAPLELLMTRHAARVALGDHPHIHQAQLFAPLPERACRRPLDLPAPLLEVDTAQNVVVQAVADWIGQHLGWPLATPQSAPRA